MARRARTRTPSRSPERTSKPRSAERGTPPRQATEPGHLEIGRVYDEPSSADGTRVLVMRKWPRGVRKERVDLWLRELGPQEDLMHGYLRGQVPWTEYRTRYLAGLARPAAQEAVEQVRRLARDGTVTLLCWCQDPDRCHRSLLRGYLQSRLV